MSTFKKKLRLALLICLVVMAAILPIPLIFYTKDKQPTHQIEQIDPKNDEDEDEDIKEIF